MIFFSEIFRIYLKTCLTNNLNWNFDKDYFFIIYRSFYGLKWTPELSPWLFFRLVYNMGIIRKPLKFGAKNFLFYWIWSMQSNSIGQKPTKIDIFYFLKISNRMTLKWWIFVNFDQNLLKFFDLWLKMFKFLLFVFDFEKFCLKALFSSKWPKNSLLLVLGKCKKFYK